MNAERRKALAAVIRCIETYQGALEEARDELDALKSEEEEYFDNMPESLRDGEKGDKAQSAIDALQEAYESLYDVCQSLEQAISSIETARG